MNASRPITDLPYSAACERNREPIRDVLTEVLPQVWNNSDRPPVLLEIGSGTGQHAAYFSGLFPRLHWQASDRAEQLDGLARRFSLMVDVTTTSRLLAPMELDVTQQDWPDGPYAAAYSANTAHIMAWPAVVAMLNGLGRVLAPGAPFILYGPFRDGARHNAPSNEEFDAFLRQRDPTMGIRDLAAVRQAAAEADLSFSREIAMPANNRILLFYRESK